MNIVPEKTCSKCGEIKSLSEFHKAKKSKFGVYSICNVCENERKRRYYKEHPFSDKQKQRLSAYKKEYYCKNVDKMRSNSQKYYSIFKNNVLARVKAYRDKNIETIREKDKLRSRNKVLSKEKIVQYNHNRRAKKIQAGGKITEMEWKNLLDFYGHKCLCCGRTDVPLELDHVIPLNPGTNTIDNAQPLCRSCNARKGRKVIDYRTK